MLTRTFSENIRKMMGHYDYNHSGSSQNLVANGWINLENDGAGLYSDDTQKPTGDGIRYNTTTNQFDFSGLTIGDIVEIRFDVQYTTLQANTEIDARMNMAIGDANNYQIPIRATLNYKNSGLQSPLKSSIKITMDNQFTIDNPAQVEVQCENDMSVVIRGYKIFIQKRYL